MSVHGWYLTEVDDDGAILRIRALSTDGVFLIQHVPNEGSGEISVTETIRVLFEAADGDTARVISEDVRSYFTQARRWSEDNLGGRVYLLFNTLDEVDVWRSTVLSGVIEFGVNALRAYSSGTIEASIIFKRLNYWETHADAALIGSGSITNNGVSTVALADPGGTLPAPVRVELTNTGGDVASRWLYLAVNSDADPGAIDLTLPGGTDSWTTEQSYGVYHLTYDFSPAELAEFRGDNYHILIGMSGEQGEWFVRASILYKIDAIYKRLSWTPDVYVTTPGIHLTTPLAIPPSGTGVTSGNISLALEIRSDTSSLALAGSYTIDWIQLMPASSFRRLKQDGFVVSNGMLWVDDGINDISYVVLSGNNMPILSTQGAPLQVIPGKASALHFVFDQYTTVDSTHTATANVYYRKRRATL